MERKQTNLLILSFLIVFGFLIRLYNLGAYPYHVDEKFTIELIAKPFWNVLVFGLSQDCNPPLFYLIDWVSVRLLGFTAFAQRFPAVVFGTLCIPAAYWLGKEFRNENVGLLTAAVVTTLGSMWYYSQFGRAYTMIVFLFTILLVYFIRIERGDTHTITWLMYGGIASLCVWTHLYALVPIGFMGLYQIYRHGLQAITKPFVTYIPIIALAGTFYAIHTQRANIMQGWMGNTVQQLLQYAFLEYFAFSAVIFVGLILISMWLNLTDDIVTALMGVWIASFVTQLFVATITPVFVRYTLLMVPMLIMVAMEPVDRFLRHEGSTTAQKMFVFSVFAAMYLIITAFQFASGAYDGRQL